MVDRAVDGPLLVLGRSWGLCVRCCVALGAVFACMFAILGRSGASAGGPGPPLGCPQAVLALRGQLLGPMLAILKPLLGFYWRSWAALRAAVCSPGPLLEAMLAVLAALGV